MMDMGIERTRLFAASRAVMLAVDPAEWERAGAALRKRLGAKDRRENARVHAAAAHQAIQEAAIRSRLVLHRASMANLSDEQYTDWLIANPAMI